MRIKKDIYRETSAVNVVLRVFSPILNKRF